MSDLELLQRRFERERAARKAAESLLERKSLEVYEANEKLKQLADQTKAIVETAAEGIISYDKNGIIQLFNRSAERIFRVQALAGQDIRQLFEPHDNVEIALFPTCVIPDADQRHQSVQNPADQNPVDQNPGGESCVQDPVELVALRESGKTFIAEIATSRNTRGNLTIFTMLVRDLSRRKMLEARLGQAQKMESVGQLAAGIAHEINTPIQFVGDNIQFLQGAFDDIGLLIDLFEQLVEAVQTHSPTEGLLKQIAEQSEIADLPFLRGEFPGAIKQSLQGIERVASIVRAMKEFSQPSSESKTSVDINHAIENALAVTIGQYREIASVETSLDPSLSPVVCLSGQINQCLLNILANAFEAIAEHCEPGTGKFHITTRRDGDNVEIRFADNGPGISSEIIERIFEPFFTTKEVGKGTGQGLAFVYDVIVDKHDGAIHAQSQPGGGTTFVISLPIASTSGANRRAHASSIH